MPANKEEGYRLFGKFKLIVCKDANDPFDWLLNSAPNFPIKIDGVTYQSVDQYYRNIASHLDAEEEYKKLREAMKIKFETFPEIKAKFLKLDPKDTIFIFDTDDGNLGRGADHRGLNILGVALMSLLDEYKNNVSIKTADENALNNYIDYQRLQLRNRDLSTLIFTPLEKKNKTKASELNKFFGSSKLVITPTISTKSFLQSTKNIETAFHGRDLRSLDKPDGSIAMLTQQPQNKEMATLYQNKLVSRNISDDGKTLNENVECLLTLYKLTYSEGNYLDPKNLPRIQVDEHTDLKLIRDLCVHVFEEEGYNIEINGFKGTKKVDRDGPDRDSVADNSLA